jgi:hypothetical protein
LSEAIRTLVLLFSCHLPSKRESRKKNAAAAAAEVRQQQHESKIKFQGIVSIWKSGENEFVVVVVSLIRINQTEALFRILSSLFISLFSTRAP